MAEMSVIAHPYAQALFDLAKQTKQEQDWMDLLQELQQISLNPDFVAILNNPKVDNAQIISVVKALLQCKSAVNVDNLLTLLAENNRFLALSEIYETFKTLVLEDQKRCEALIESAYAMSSSEKQDFEQLLSKKFGKTITATVVVRPELLAGIKVTINDKVIDGSVRGRLNNLATQLTK
jgi:F-type H+-transporting ATPase subunit delta